MATTGKFITMEGGEGAGKTTQCARLAAYLEGKDIEVTITREPGGTPGALALRELLVTGDGDRWDPVSEALLMYAARRDHVERLIKPALAKGQWVLCDRFSDSTMAYQGYAKALGRDWVSALDGLAMDGFKPDLTLLLDMPSDMGLGRAAVRGGPDRFEKLGARFHEDLRSAFLDIAKREPERIVVLDATGSQDAVAERIEKTVTRHLLDEFFDE